MMRLIIEKVYKITDFIIEKVCETADFIIEKVWSLFGFIIIFISKFGTNYIAAHQAAMSFSSVLYMLPLSFSLALTIIIGIEVGAKRYLEAKKYAYLGLIVSFLCVLSIVGLVFYFRDYIALLYATDTTLLIYIALLISP